MTMVLSYLVVATHSTFQVTKKWNYNCDFCVLENFGLDYRSQNDGF